ncbi:MAG: nucleotidyltransferase family protein, partial [Clostridia bacterium]
SFDKYTRASWGIRGGADIVFELPAVFSSAYAMQFARGGVFLLSQIPQVSDVVFGSENGDIVQLQKFSNKLDNPTDKTNTAFRELLDLGQSYPKVLSDSLKKVAEDDLEEFQDNLLPNNILAIEYLRALKFFDSKITPHSVCRLSDTSKYMSASEIRKNLVENGDNSQLKQYVPPFTYDDLNKNTSQSNANDNLFRLLKFKLLSMSTPLSEISEVTEGIENRFVKSLEMANNYEEYIHLVKTKRYTMAKIKRILLSILLEKTKAIDKTAFDNIEYLKVLAVAATKKELLSIDCPLTFITKAADFSKLSEKSIPYLRIDKTADDLFNVCNNEKTTALFTHKMSVVD